MALYNFRIANIKYELINVTNEFYASEELMLLSDHGVLLSLQRVEESGNNQVVSHIVGDMPIEDCIDLKGSYFKQLKYHFVTSFENFSSVADRIANERALQYLRNKEYSMF